MFVFLETIKKVKEKGEKVVDMRGWFMVFYLSAHERGP